jgi:hypothetical protein
MAEAQHHNRRRQSCLLGRQRGVYVWGVLRPNIVGV